MGKEMCWPFPSLHPLTLPSPPPAAPYPAAPLKSFPSRLPPEGLFCWLASFLPLRRSPLLACSPSAQVKLAGCR